MTSQSAVFSKDSKKLYVLGMLYPDPEGFLAHVVYVYNVIAPGIIVYSGISIPLFDLVSGGGLYRVDVMAIESSGRYLFVSNQTESPGENRIAVVDLRTNAHVLSLVACGDDDCPVGIAFKQY